MALAGTDRTTGMAVANAGLDVPALANRNAPPLCHRSSPSELTDFPTTGSCLPGRARPLLRPVVRQRAQGLACGGGPLQPLLATAVLLGLEGAHDELLGEWVQGGSSLPGLPLLLCREEGFSTGDEGRDLLVDQNDGRVPRRVRQEVLRLFPLVRVQAGDRARIEEGPAPVVVGNEELPRPRVYLLRTRLVADGAHRHGAPHAVVQCAARTVVEDVLGGEALHERDRAMRGAGAGGSLGSHSAAGRAQGLTTRDLTARPWPVGGCGPSLRATAQAGLREGRAKWL
eukprot:CAMPEP_0179083702 /NCGR_PEP_ID=MMETSP0796-20121207/37812_1 /TAXON_ID=73915 /ORGANISM="Pyrodinium bahamense, Strain pbaha01" /LENGTH=284 /DNA_ID=CAMNT_0020781113 /DNA_START=12 /DNA_END=862 /DNA_ORIENTATION=+